jgi:hypothetical protein
MQRGLKDNSLPDAMARLRTERWQILEVFRSRFMAFAIPKRPFVDGIEGIDGGSGGLAARPSTLAWTTASRISIACRTRSVSPRTPALSANPTAVAAAVAAKAVARVVTAAQGRQKGNRGQPLRRRRGAR